jgi:hypothetical protein
VNTRARQPVLILIYQCTQTMFVHACLGKGIVPDINRTRGKIRDKEMMCEWLKHVKINKVMCMNGMHECM